MRVLTIDNDAPTRKRVAFTLMKAGLATAFAQNAKDGLELAASQRHALIILELCLPDMCGEKLLRALRSADIDTPVVVLSRVSAVETKVRAFHAGADDYLTKPFNALELVARVRAVLRRSGKPLGQIISVGQLVINLDARTVEVGGTPVHVSRSQYKMLELLARRKGYTLSRLTLHSQLYHGSEAPALKTIDVCVCNLRRKLQEASGAGNYIHTVRGEGYRLDKPTGP